MFSCTRCGSSFDEMAVASMGDCPRCKGRDGVTIELESARSSTRSASSEAPDGAPPSAEAPDLEP
jgi:predicted  nucleic acid-binding Zn-ribbon protein